jgi:hypothetical protein
MLAIIFGRDGGLQRHEPFGVRQPDPEDAILLCAWGEAHDDPGYD